MSLFQMVMCRLQKLLFMIIPTINFIVAPTKPIGQYSDSKSAYEAIIEFGNKYIMKSGGKINRINNPYNTEFVDQSTQQGIVDEQSISVDYNNAFQPTAKCIS